MNGCLSCFYGTFWLCPIAYILGTLVAVNLLGLFGAPFWLWALAIQGVLFGFGAPCWLMWVVLGVSLVFILKPLRRILVSSIMMKVILKLDLVPKVSDTEKAALDAGTVWVESDFFSGKPNLKRLMSEPIPQLTAEEKAYVDGPIEELCKMIDDWNIHLHKEIPKPVWDHMKKIRIFGMIIPKKYGGLQFSALAHSQVLLKLSSRSLPVTITAMVPNSLGPAELLNHFGTEEQKNYYLPRLASGEDMPCFALTEPRAGSDAGSIESEGVLFKKDGKLFIRLNWNKRWITLASISTVLGLAFQLRDPEKLLGGEEDLGITCALIPSNTPGVVLGRRHDPLGVPFHNCPTQGKDVVVSVDNIIGGIANAGKGWTMLMDSLGAGRGISLPAQSTGSCKLIARVVGNHSSIRKQFGVAIAKLEGVEEPLAIVGGLTYALEAMRLYTLGAIDQGKKPAVITAIAKANATELARVMGSGAMDVMAGAGITQGPRNLVSKLYIAAPIGITVEGANILTRTLIIFGQGLFRAHPWAYKEVTALDKKDLVLFDTAIWSHLGHVVRNLFRAKILWIFRGHFVCTPVKGPLKRYSQKLSWVSATFATLTDVAMGSLGGELKRKEKLAGRFADVLSWMYIATAVMRRFEADGSKKEDLPFVHVALRYGFTQIQNAFDGIFANLPVPGLTWVMKWIVRPLFRVNVFTPGISDELSHKAAVALVAPGEARDRLCEGIYYPTDRNEQLGRLEYSYKIIRQSEEIERKISKAVRKGQLPKDRIYQLVVPALKQGVITEAEAQVMKEASIARWDACQVDDFSEDGYQGKPDTSVSPTVQYRGPAGPPQY